MQERDPAATVLACAWSWCWQLPGREVLMLVQALAHKGRMGVRVGGDAARHILEEWKASARCGGLGYKLCTLGK